MWRCLILALLFLAAPARAEWLVAETPHVRIFANSSEAALRQRAETLEDFRQLLVTTTGRNEDAGADIPRLDIHVLANMPDAWPFSSAITNELGRARSRGFYRATPGGIAVFVADIDRSLPILLRQYAQHVLYSTSGGHWPAWYIEGFAEYYAHARFHTDRVDYGFLGRTTKEALASANWLPLDQVLARDARLRVPGNIPLFLRQSALLTHYMLRQPGHPQKLEAYLKAVQQGMDPVEAFRTHVDPDLAGFNARLARYLQFRPTYSSQPRATPAPANVRITRLPPAARDLLLPIAVLEQMPPAEPGAKSPVHSRARQVIHKAAARHPDAPLAQRALALLALRTGEPADAAARLDPLIAATPDDPQLLRWRALSEPATTPESRATALAFLARAIASDPQDWRSLRAHALISGARTGPIGAQPLGHLVRAWQLAPQIHEIGFDLSLALVHAGRFTEAEAVLAPIAANVHYTARAAQARTLIAAARSASAPAFLAALNRPVTTP